VSLNNGGTGYAASSPLDLLAHIGGTNASNLSLGILSPTLIAANSIPGADIVNNSVTDTQLSTTGVSQGVY
jgi:hypothetical protein